MCLRHDECRLHESVLSSSSPLLASGCAAVEIKPAVIASTLTDALLHPKLLRPKLLRPKLLRPKLLRPKLLRPKPYVVAPLELSGSVSSVSVQASVHRNIRCCLSKLEISKLQD